MWILFFIYGLFIGSFLNVCIYRIPADISIVRPPSFCGSCGHRLRAFDMIPVFTYIINKGKCRYCNAPYSIQYPIIELLNAMLYMFIGIKYGLGFYSLIYCILISVFIVISLIDIKHKIIPDRLNAMILVIAVICMFYDKTLIINKLIGFGIGLGLFLLISITTNAMGGGDIKFIAVLGLMFGIKGIMFIIFVSFIISAIISIILIILKIKNKKDEIPFGPFISLSAMIYIFWGSEIIAWYC